MNIKTLHSLFLQAKKVTTDSRHIERNSMFFALKGEHFNGNNFAEEALNKGASYAVIDEKKYKTDNRMILVDDVLKTLQDLAGYHRKKLNIPILSLTGSNGKTTTKELINAVLSKKFNTVATRGNFNNHIGVPLTLLTMDETTEFGIVEMGANHQGEITFLCDIATPDYGCITNFGKAHLEGFGGIKGIIKGKSELYDHLIQNHKQIFYNADDPIQTDKLKDYDKKYSFGQRHHKGNLKIEYKIIPPFINVLIDENN
ncbi:MAG: Mur ligase family protein, partial [Bacteroidota bacterium]